MDLIATQDNRMAALSTPLGKDVLLLTHMDMVEALSEQFEVRVQCLSQFKSNLDFNQLIGKGASIRLKTVGRKTRFFHGIVVEAAWAGERERMSAYHLVMRPWMWLLTHTRNSRIFQNMKVEDIITKVFTDAGFSDFKFDLSQPYQKREYCVQYRESDFDFVCRLMEEEGMYYFFKHTEDKHELNIVDSKSAHKAIPDLPKVTFLGAGERTRDDKEFLRDWTSERRFQTGKVTVNGFDFAAPTAHMLKEEAQPGGYSNGNLERYHYPYKYKSGEDNMASKFAKAVLEGAQAQDRRRHANGDAPSLFPGGLTTLEGHKDTVENIQYLVVRASHSFVGESFLSGAGHGGSDDSYFGSYVLQPASRQYRAPHVTPRPVIPGPQTAMVVGPAGEEIHTDKYGRIKVKFHWDRAPDRDDKASRWVRVSQMWSGKQWGGFYIPRIGQEVVIEFIEGDPDRPLVVGTVYNAQNMMPYKMPDNKTQHGMKTRSSKGGSDSNYNELVYEDKKGEEFVRFHAEKDLMSTIEDTETRTIMGKGRKGAGPGYKTRVTTIVKGDDITELKDGDRKVKISRDENVWIGRHWNYYADDTITIEAKNKITLKCGDSSIVMDRSSIKIKTKILDTESDKLTEKSKMIEINASGVFTQKGAMILIN